MTEPRYAVSFKDADPIWKAIFAWSKNPNGSDECLAILDAVGDLVAATRREAIEEAARIIEDEARENGWLYDKAAIIEILADTIRQRAKK